MHAALSYADQHRHPWLEQFFDFLRIPSISALPEHRGDQEACARWLADHLAQIGVPEVKLLPNQGPPVVFGEWQGRAGGITALVYGHYDVQPVDPLHEWETPPFEPSLRSNLVFARGAADDKGQVFMHLKAAEAYLQGDGALPINLKFLIEGEEEIGSPHLDSFLLAHRDLFNDVDLVVVSDTNMLGPGLPSLTYGLRGLVYCQVDLQGPARDLHSGSYGGAVANPAQVLAGLLSRLKDEDGRVTAPGFYDDVRPITDQERQAFGQLPFDQERFREEVGAPALAGEKGYSILERIWARPTLDVNGIWGGFTGEGSKTIIPARASAKLSCRLVPDQDPDRIVELLEKSIRDLCPPTVSLHFTRMAGGKPCLTPLDHPAIQAALRALERGFGAKPVLIREGGSVPVVASFQHLLNLPAVLMGVAPHDSHAHAPNERFGLENLEGGIRSAIHLWDELSRTKL